MSRISSSVVALAAACLMSLYYSPVLAGNFETCISGNRPILCKHHLLTPAQLKQVKVAEAADNYKTCISGNRPILCKHHLLTPAQLQRVKAAELGGNDTTAGIAAFNEGTPATNNTSPTLAETSAKLTGAQQAIELEKQKRIQIEQELATLRVSQAK